MSTNTYTATTTEAVPAPTILMQLNTISTYAIGFFKSMSMNKVILLSIFTSITLSGCAGNSNNIKLKKQTEKILYDLGKELEAFEAEQSGDSRLAFKKYLVLAQNESNPRRTSSQYNLADFYRNGVGVNKDPYREVYWLKKVATAGDPIALTHRQYKNLAQARLMRIYIGSSLGESRYYTDDIPVNYVEAYKWGKMASNSSSSLRHNEMFDILKTVPEVVVSRYPYEFGKYRSKKYSKNELTKMPRSGDDLDIDVVRKLAQNDPKNIGPIMAKFYLDGIQTKKSIEKGAAWMFLSAKTGNKESSYNLVNLIMKHKLSVDPLKDVRYWLEKSAEQDYAPAQFFLGKMLVSKHKYKSEKDKGLKLIEMSAKQGHVDALIYLGNAFRFGTRGKSVDKNKAIQLLTQAKMNGSELAHSLLLEIVGTNKIEVIKIVEREIIKEVAVNTPPAQPTTPNAREIYKRLSPSVLKISAGNIQKKNGELDFLSNSQGSGVAISKDTLLTNHHVIDGSNTSFVVINDKPVLLQVISCKEAIDICVMRVEGNTRLIPVKTHKQLDQVFIGDKVYAIGSPHGYKNSLSDGIVSGKRPMKGTGVHIQFTADISPGSSGGGLFDSNGALIGITTFLRKDANSLYFAVPSKPFVDATLHSGLSSVSAPQPLIFESGGFY
jgi:S1-C subfamily serine protease